MTVALEIKNVSHNFGEFKALSNVSLNILPGDFTVLLGLNGAGKTTLYSLITRLYNNNSGSIKIYGFDVRENSVNALKNIGVVFQQPTLDLDLSVRENLQYHSSLHGLSFSEASQRIDNEIGRIKLEDKIKSKVRALSGGQRRRVEIARSLIHRPKLLLLDEPTVGLDIGSRQMILKHVKTLCKENNLAVLWATHLIDEIDKGEKVIIINNGKVLESGDVSMIVKKTKTKNIRDAFNKLVGI
ncbi:MAG: ABC transporter ATP-binding protein [Rickettsiales bacterium]|nr:ABC transporter ATP-binding protein [Rickettsiales bacterium]|tara:strand:+ start:102 stop:827 length:726 start_codon:yes stop_codon:yes gene_type:complete